MTCLVTDRDVGPPEMVGELREQLGRIDRRLVRLLAERERLQWQLLAYKQALGIPLLDPAQEARVRQRARLAALQTTGDPHLAEEVVVRAIRSGMERYSERWLTDPTGVRPHPEPAPFRTVRPGTPAWVASP